MQLYAVAFDSPCRIAFYWADDVEHAREQALSEPTSEQFVYAVRAVPGEYCQDVDGQMIIETGWWLPL